jgi:hypothetical protein
MLLPGRQQNPEWKHLRQDRVLREQATGGSEVTQAQTPEAAGDITQELIDADWWSDDMVGRAGIPVYDVPFVTVGGGFGSLAVVNILRIAGVPTSAIRILTTLDLPYQTWSYLCENSQIPPHERIRSDSASEMGNVWGFPGYAVREAFAARNLRGFIAPLFQVATEPILTDFYTPRKQQVNDDVERECRRIQWSSMVQKGQVRMVRRRYGGGYFSILTPPEGQFATKRVAFRSRWVHIAVGYPGVQFLRDLQEYRDKYKDYARVVNAYEPHNHVYEELLRKPSTVVVRGGGIVSSRVLQRLMEDRFNYGAQTQIWHLFRTYYTGKNAKYGPAQRPGGRGFAYQAFNWPKAGWGGQLMRKLQRSDVTGRAEILKSLSGTTTVKRKLWQVEIKRAEAEGWYRQYQGQVTEVVPGAEGTIVTRIMSPQGQAFELPANYIIDATGLEGDIREHRVVRDLLEHGGARQNPMGRLEVGLNHEIIGTRADPGRMYGTGAMTLGSHVAVADSILGLQIAAMDVVVDLASQGFCKKISSIRSILGWWKWALNKQI